MASLAVVDNPFLQSLAVRKVLSAEEKVRSVGIKRMVKKRKTDRRSKNVKEELGKATSDLSTGCIHRMADTRAPSGRVGIMRSQPRRSLQVNK